MEAEELENKKCHGTPVTVDNFLSWKASFDAEMAALKQIQNKEKERDEKDKKMTGRELFMTDKSLIDSDLKFLEEGGGEVVRVDESLFQDLDDLDLDGELEDDEEDQSEFFK